MQQPSVFPEILMSLGEFRAGSKTIRRAGVIAAALILSTGVNAAGAQVLANMTSSAPGLTRPDGEPLSKYFQVQAGASLSSLEYLYVYSAQVKAINFPDFISDLTNQRYDPNIGLGDSRGAYTHNLGDASFASFQAETAGLTNVVKVSFRPGYPAIPVSATHPVKILDNSQNYAGGSNLSGVTYNPDGSFSFSVTERVDAKTGFGIPQQITIEVGDNKDGNDLGADFLNSLHLFINPHPDSTNQKPATPTEVLPGAHITQASFPAGATAYHLGSGIYWIAGNLTFSNGAEVYLEDGAILKWITPAYPALNNGDMITVSNQNGGNSIFHGWGIIDGQAQQQQAAPGKTVPYTNPSTGVTTQVSVPDYCGTNGAAPIQGYRLRASATQKALIDGIVIRNSGAFNLPMWGPLGTVGHPVTINNIKILGYSGATTPGTANADGIDLIGAQYIDVTNSFIRTSDDLLTLKQTAAAGTTGAVPVININVVNNTFWNEVAHAMVIGGELYNAPNINQPTNPIAADDVVFDHNTIIRDTGKAPLMSLLNNFGGNVQNVVFSNTTAYQSVALIGMQLDPTGPRTQVAPTGTSYSIAPSTGVGSTLQSVVTFNTEAQAAPIALGGQTIQLSGFSTMTDFNNRYATVLATPTPTATSFAANVLLNNPVSTTATGTEPNAYITLFGEPGKTGSFKFCNITQMTAQVNTVPVIGSGTAYNPYLRPLSNIQMLISLPSGNPYVGGSKLPAGTTGTETVFPQVIVNLPQFSNVQVVTDPVSKVLKTVSTYTAGNDFYYQTTTGVNEDSNGNTISGVATVPGDQVEQTVRQRTYTSSNPYQLFSYFTSGINVAGEPVLNQIPGDMVTPQFVTGHTTGDGYCDASILMPKP